MAKVSLAKLFDRVNEIDKTSQVAVMQSEDSLQISEKNRVDLERLIATLRVDGDFQTDTVKPDSSPQQSVADSSPSLDNTLQQSFANLTSSVEILRQDVDQLYQAFYLSQQGRQSILQQEDRALFKEEDALQKKIGQKSERGGLSRAMKRDPNQRQQDLEREVGKKRKAILKGLGLGLLSSFGMALGTSDIGNAAPDSAEQTSQPQTQTQGVSGTGEEFRVAAGLLTEGAKGQAAIDVLQVVANRASANGKSYTDVLAAPGQFQGVFKRDVTQFRKITTAEEAAKWAGVSVGDIEQTVKDMRNQSMIEKAQKHVKGATQFRGSPSTVRSVNNDDDPNNDIAADKDGRMPGTSWRGGAGDNQFMTDFSGKNNPIGPDPTIGDPAKINISTNPNFRPVVANEGYETASLPPSTANIASINLPPQIIDGGTSGGQQRGQARAEGPPSVHSTTNPTMFGNVITNRFLSVAV